MIFSLGSHPLRENMLSRSSKRPRREWSKRLREGPARRMRRLAPGARYHRPRRQDRSSNGLDDDQEWRAVGAGGRAGLSVRHPGLKIVLLSEPYFLFHDRHRSLPENKP